MPYTMAGRSRDPRDIAPPGSYMTDGDVLVQVLEVDYGGAVGENVVDGELVSINPQDLRQRWRRVTPKKEKP
jgi:hypothetical protein